MEKILSKEMLLQNFNSTNMFLVKNCMLQIFDELLKGKQGLLTMQDIIFSHKSEVQAEEFLKTMSTHFLKISSRNMQMWDNFFSVLEQRQRYLPISRMILLDMYLSGKLSKEEKHRCCIWLNNHCRIGYHQTLILKMLSYPEDTKLLLLAKKYCRQEASLSQEELEKICSLPIRTFRKLEIFSLFIQQKNQDYNFCIIKELMRDLTDSSIRATQEEKNKMWEMLVELFQNNPLIIDIKLFNELYQKKQLTSEIYLKILDIYARQTNTYSLSVDDLIAGCVQIVVVEKKRSVLKSISEIIFFLLEQKKPQITEKLMVLMLKIITLWKEEMWFKIEYLPVFKAKMYQGAMLVKKINFSTLKQYIKIDEQLFLILVSSIEKKDVKNLLEEIAYNYSELWQESLDNILSNTTLDILLIIQIIAELYKAAEKEKYKQIFFKSLEMLLNNLPEKENVVANSNHLLSFMYDNVDLKNLVDNYLKQANVSMTNLMIG